MEIYFWSMVWDITKIVIIPIEADLHFITSCMENLTGLIKQCHCFLWEALLLS